MQKASLNADLKYGNEKPVIQKLMETPFSKEIRIVFKTGQIMKEHLFCAPQRRTKNVHLIIK